MGMEGHSSWKHLPVWSSMASVTKEIIIPPVELTWFWSILLELRQLRGVWKGICTLSAFQKVSESYGESCQGQDLFKACATSVSLSPSEPQLGLVLAHRVYWRLYSAVSLHWLQANHSKVRISGFCLAFIEYFHFIHSMPLSSVWHLVWFPGFMSIENKTSRERKPGKLNWWKNIESFFHFPKSFFP